ncbi:hypothetical protein SARC_10834 [Sphaeroforma arctica JP610]|uniref:Uncharacterized protein n=1 Tax=Sphaeroforma arctica JP610 TaxID=667725 RepID=A0A0L0FIV0_9EUKA|nr:hypothetical protein SARC_10834 [Sphaeroforma arctica JP610]KNC76675.1 hypothetical protein SARC_10834 [Sphaeroforma arctica JP610]|eukprot:XP_014150577.1 hypothetical protein SARC_10834 [Sphaeroforma arctica JP610]
MSHVHICILINGQQLFLMILCVSKSLEVSVLRLKLPISARAVAAGSSNLFKAELLTRLSENAVRNEIVIDKVVACVAVGRKVLVLSDRRAHLEVLRAILNEREQDISSAYYMGGMTEAALRRAVCFSWAYDPQRAYLILTS